MEQSLFDVTSDRHFATWIFANNMTSADTVEIKVYVKDTYGVGAMRVYTTQTLTGAQPDPAYFVPFVPSRQYKVTIKRTAGTDRAYNWMRIEVT